MSDSIIEGLIEALVDVVIAPLSLLPWWVNAGLVAVVVGFLIWVCS